MALTGINKLELELFSLRALRDYSAPGRMRDKLELARSHCDSVCEPYAIFHLSCGHICTLRIRSGDLASDNATN